MEGMKRVAVFVAEGFEEIELVSTVDVLRRGGVEVTLVAVSDGNALAGGHGIRLMTDGTVESIDHRRFDAFILPGGGTGVENLCRSTALRPVLSDAMARGALVGAICAAPVVLASFGLLEGRRCTCYPSVRDRLGDVRYLDDPVVVDGNLVTSRGPATAVTFGLTLLACIAGRTVAATVADGLLYAGPDIP